MSLINGENYDKPILCGLQPNAVTPVGLTGSPYIGGKLLKNKKTINRKKNINKSKKNCKHVYAGKSKKCIKCEYKKIFRNKSKKKLLKIDN